MTDSAAPPKRTGQSNAPEDAVSSYTLIIFAHERHGSLDRIVAMLRRRRAKVHNFAIGHSEVPDVVRITVIVDDSEVGVEQLVEQLRKVVDVRHIVNLSSGEAVAHELALIKVNSTATQQGEIIELGHLFGAHTIDVTQETVMLEVSGSCEKVEKLLNLLQSYGIREVAHTGCVAMTRGVTEM